MSLDRSGADSTDPALPDSNLTRPDGIGPDRIGPHSAARRPGLVAFLRQLARRLAPGGLVSLHLGTLPQDLTRVVEGMSRLRAAFKIVHPMGTPVPPFDCFRLFAVASRDRDPVAIDADLLRERQHARRIGALGLYHADHHAVLFTLPARLKESLSPGPALSPAPPTDQDDARPGAPR